MKANAYGHGAPATALALQEAGATMLAVADIEEGIVLRNAGVTAEILIFGALSVSDVAGVFDYNLTPTISTPGAGRSLQAAAARRGVRLGCHLKIDTGMNRLGLRFDNLEYTLPEIVASGNLQIDAVYTHFATADDADHPLFQEQRERFDQVLARLPELRHPPAADSRGQQRGHAARFARVVRSRAAGAVDVRRGAAAAGVHDSVEAGDVAAQPRGGREGREGRARSSATARTGRRRSPGASPLCRRDMPMAWTCGWPAAGIVLIRGRRAPIVGSVCMDMIMVDVADVQVETGDEVVIIGEQGDERIDVREIAAAIGTNPYEVLCRIGTRIERLYQMASR